MSAGTPNTEYTMKQLAIHLTNEEKKHTHIAIQKKIFSRPNIKIHKHQNTLAWHSKTKQKQGMNLNKRAVCEMDKNVRNVKRPPHKKTQQEQTNAH